MNIRKLNEQLDKLLKEPINEISDELRNKVIDARQAEYLAAQATADRKKAKFDRISKLGKKLEKKTPETVINSLKDIGDTLNVEYSKPESYGEDYIMILTVPEYFENGKLTKSAEEELKKLLEEMSDKYGCKYTYKVEKDTVKIICENPNIDIDKLDKNSDGYYFKIVSPLIKRGQDLFRNMLGKELPDMNKVFGIGFTDCGIDYYSGNFCYVDDWNDNGFFISNMVDESGFPDADITVCSTDINYSTLLDIPINYPITDDEYKKIIKKVYMKLYKTYTNRDYMIKFIRNMDDIMYDEYYIDYYELNDDDYYAVKFVSNHDNSDYGYVFIKESTDSIEFANQEDELPGGHHTYSLVKKLNKSDITEKNLKSILNQFI